MYNSFIDTSYDKKLSKIHHFEIHPELLPFVGANYDKYKVLLIGESHYIDLKKSYGRMEMFNNWYEISTNKMLEDANTANFEYFTHWFNTREVVNRFLCKNRTRAHHIFQYPAQLIQNKYNCTSDSESFSMVSFFNYFQRPNMTPGGSFKSININIDEYNFASKTANEIFDCLKPNLIIFLSKKAFDAYTNDKNAKWCNNIHYVNHPCSPWWYRDNGKEKFRTIIDKYDKNNSLIDLNDLKCCSVIEIFSKKLFKSLTDNGFKNMKLYDEYNDFYKKSDEYNIILIENKFRVCIHDNLYIWLGNKNDWEYIPDNVTPINFRHPGNDYPLNDEAMDELVNRTVEAIKKIIK